METFQAPHGNSQDVSSALYWSNRPLTLVHTSHIQKCAKYSMVQCKLLSMTSGFYLLLYITFTSLEQNSFQMFASLYTRRILFRQLGRFISHDEKLSFDNLEQLKFQIACCQGIFLFF